MELQSNFRYNQQQSGELCPSCWLTLPDGDGPNSAAARVAGLPDPFEDESLLLSFESSSNLMRASALIARIAKAFKAS